MLLQAGEPAAAWQSVGVGQGPGLATKTLRHVKARNPLAHTGKFHSLLSTRRSDVSMQLPTPMEASFLLAEADVPRIFDLFFGIGFVVAFWYGIKPVYDGLFPEFPDAFEPPNIAGIGAKRMTEEEAIAEAERLRSNIREAALNGDIKGVRDGERALKQHCMEQRLDFNFDLPRPEEEFWSAAAARERREGRRDRLEDDNRPDGKYF